MHVAFAIFAIISTARGIIDTGSDVQYRVTLDIFSGRPNPSWLVDRASPLYGRVAFGAHRRPPTPVPRVLGYRGFFIESNNAFGQLAFKTVGVGSDPELEQALFDSNPVPLPPDVRRHFIEALNGRRHYRVVNVTPGLILPPLMPPSILKMWLNFCVHPKFEPDLWNIPGVQFENNCYNYATNRITGIFAQPGRASGHIYQELTAPSVFAAAMRDGFAYLPFYIPFIGPKMFPSLCYMALVIWPNVDYHWYRLDIDGTWSHKMGGTPVTKDDNNGDPIHDPMHADRGNYVVFAAYVGNHWGAVVQ